MNKGIKSLTEMHAEHRKWQSDISMWQDDINEWQLQMGLALETLEQFAALIRRDKTAIERHAGALKSIITNLEIHEKSMAQNLRTGAETDSGAELASRHASRVTFFESQSENHERLKKRHRAAMARAAALEAVLKTAETE